MHTFDQPFDGTIVRIPLRTEEQAAKSEIVNRETTTTEIIEVLGKFATEFGDKGLLFLKNVDKLILENSSGMSTQIMLADDAVIQSYVHERFLHVTILLTISDISHESMALSTVL